MLFLNKIFTNDRISQAKLIFDSLHVFAVLYKLSTTSVLNKGIQKKFGFSLKLLNVDIYLPFCFKVSKLSVYSPYRINCHSVLKSK